MTPPKSRPAGPVSAKLNPAYFAQRGLVPLGLNDERLAVGMADVGDHETIAALHLATGYAIDPVAMSVAEIRALLDRGPLPQPASPGPAPRPSGNAESLLDHLLRWGRGESGGTFLLPLAQLLDAGYAPVEAGEVLLGAQAGGHRTGPALADLSARLASGTELEAALLESPDVPRWIADAVASCHQPADQLAALGGIVFATREAARQRESARRLALEAGLWSLPIIAAWLAVSVPTGILAMLLCVFALAQVGSLTTRGPRNEFVHGEVLAIIAVLADLRVPPASAIRGGLSRLNAVAPTWGRLPDCREELANALDLPPLSAALLMRGELGSAATRVSAICAERGRRKTENGRWLVHSLGFVLFALALVVLPV